MSLTRLIAYGVLTAAVACLVVMWALFGTMYVRGTTEVTIAANMYNEFAVELVVLTLAIVFLPVAVYEFDRSLATDDSAS